MRDREPGEQDYQGNRAYAGRKSNHSLQADNRAFAFPEPRVLVDVLHA
jgi:hypothetical protein